MYYFITNRQDQLTSSIEMAEIQRLKLFDQLHQPAQIITLQYNFAHSEVEKRFDIDGRVTNLFQYYQQLPYQTDPEVDRQIIKQALNQPGYVVNGQIATLNGKKRIQVVLDPYRNNRLYSISYYDRFGFLDRTDFYDNACRSFTEFLEDKGRRVIRQYYDANGAPKLCYYYRGGDGNIPVLTMIQLNDGGQVHTFDNVDQLRAYFLDQIVAKDPHPILISDRSDYALKAFQLMLHQEVPRYQVLHSSFTVDGQADSQLFDVYKPVAGMLTSHMLTGLISSTQEEANDAGRRFHTKNSYGIPVKSISNDLLHKQIPFEKRQKGQLIAVARLSNVKRLDHIINAVVQMHQKLPFVDLKIYGYDENINNYATSTSLKQIVKHNHAEDYVHFCGYKTDLTEVYETADIEVLTSSFEGFAVALLEAQAHACPVVSYDINYGPSEIINDQQSGILLPAGDTDQLLRTLMDLETNRGKLRQLSANAQAAAAKYSIDNIRQDWANFIAQQH